MAGILWTIAVIFLIFWLLGFLVWHLPALIHIALVIALIVIVVNLLSGRKAV